MLPPTSAGLKRQLRAETKEVDPPKLPGERRGAVGYQCGIGAMQLPASLSPSARLPWPLVEMDCSLRLVSGAGKPGRRGALTDLFMSIFATPDPQMAQVKVKLYPYYRGGGIQGCRGNFSVDGNRASQPRRNFRALA